MEVRQANGSGYLEIPLFVNPNAARVPAAEITEDAANDALATFEANVAATNAQLADSTAYRLESGLAIELLIRVADPTLFAPNTTLWSSTQWAAKTHRGRLTS